ncbi:MATE family efflux transporter [Marinobacterium sp. CAU 1594]|nr:MATE family efflux transporter [Marinobacterium arenosum]
MIAQLAYAAMGFVDTLMAGQVGAQDLAAVALGSSLWLPLFLALQGILMATTPLVAHQVGADQTRASVHTLHQGSWIALALGALAWLLLNNCAPVLQLMQVEPALAAKTNDYLKAIAWGFPAILLYQVIRSYSEGFGQTRPIMKIAVLGLLCNIPLNYVLIYGKLGLPAMGGVGCGWATALVMWIMLACGTLYLKRSTLFQPLSPFGRLRRPDPAALWPFLKLGIPIGSALLMESSMFSVIALLLASQGETAIASHQITLSFTGMTFMVPLSISMAITIRVGQLLGRNDRAGARFAAFTGLQLTLLCALCSSSLMLGLPEFIAGWYTSEAQLIELAAGLLGIAALFQFSDAIQVACAGALRGYKDTFVPLTLVFVAYWVIGLPTGYLLGLTDLLRPAMGPAGFWIALVIGLSAGAILLLCRLLIITRRSPPLPASA